MTQISTDEWQKAQQFEAGWWSDCANTMGEELKQLDYARMMGLRQFNVDQKPYFDLQGKSVLDLGGGAVSLLLKCDNKGRAVVVDPMPMPEWILGRYKAAGIEFYNMAAEDVNTGLLALNSDNPFDEVWIYNVLQHVQDTQKIIENAKSLGKIIRIFEWIETPPHDGHPHTLKAEELDKWLEGEGRVEKLDPKVWSSYGIAYYGIFPTKFYEGKVESRNQENNAVSKIRKITQEISSLGKDLADVKEQMGQLE